MNQVYVLRELRHLDALLAFLASNWEAMSRTKHPMQVTCVPESTSRNVQQNRRYWAIVHQIAEQAWIGGRQYSSEIWHEHMKRTFLGVVDLPSGQTMAQSTAALSTRDFADYCQRVEAYAATELGITLVEAA